MFSREHEQDRVIDIFLTGDQEQALVMVRRENNSGLGHDSTTECLSRLSIWWPGQVSWPGPSRENGTGHEIFHDQDLFMARKHALCYKMDNKFYSILYILYVN